MMRSDCIRDKNRLPLGLKIYGFDVIEALRQPVCCAFNRSDHIPDRTVSSPLYHLPQV